MGCNNSDGKEVGWTSASNEHVSKYYRAIMQIQWLIRVEKGIFRDTLMETMIMIIEMIQMVVRILTEVGCNMCHDFIPPSIVKLFHKTCYNFTCRCQYNTALALLWLYFLQEYIYIVYTYSYMLQVK